MYLILTKKEKKKKIIYLFGLILSIMIVSCQQKDGPFNGPEAEEVQEVKAQFFSTIQTASSGENFGDLKSTSTDPLYDRNGAPVYVDGITITADNKTLYSYGVKTETFMFEANEADEDRPIEMTIGVGSNEFSAVGVPTYTAGAWTEQDFATKDVSAELVDRAAVYSPVLTGLHPIYVEYYTDSIAKQVVTFNTNWYNALLLSDPYGEDGNTGLTLKEMQDYTRTNQNGDYLQYWKSGYFDVWPGFVQLILNPQTGRTNIVFEAEKDAYYRVTPTLYDAAGVVIESVELLHDGIANASAVIFNTAAMVDGTYIEVLVERSDDGSVGSYIPVTDASNINIPTQIGKNVTHVINFDGDDNISTEANVTNYNPITTEQDTHTLDES